MLQASGHISELPYFTPRGIPPAKRAQILRYLLLAWRPDAIAEECHVSSSTVYNIERNLMLYGSTAKPRYRQLRRSPKLSEADKQALFECLLREGWRQQDEMVYWLFHERGVNIHRSIISRLLKKRGWTKKEIQRISLARSEPLRHVDGFADFIGGAGDSIGLAGRIDDELFDWAALISLWGLPVCWREALRVVYGTTTPQNFSI